MGNEFLFKTEESFRKDHDRARMKMSEPDLFPVVTNNNATIAAKPIEGFSFGEGDVYELIADQDCITIYCDMAPVGICENPPRSVVDEIKVLGRGRAVGTLHRRRRHGGAADIAVIVDP